MKINKGLLVVILILGIVSIGLDKELSYYGRNVLDVYNSLPLKAKPVFRYEFDGGFAIEDSYGFYLASQGRNRYVGNEGEVNIEEIIRYGFNDERLAVEVTDSIGRLFYIEFMEREEVQPEQSLKAKIWKGQDTALELDSFEWVEIENNEDYIRVLSIFRNYSILLISVLCLVFIFRIFRSK